MIIKKETLKTERIVLRSFEDKDRERLVELLTNREISETFMIPDYDSIDLYYELADKLIGFSKDESHLEYGVYLNDALIGFVNDCGFDKEIIEVGYVIDPLYKNNGYASEALKLVIDYLWKLGFKKVKAGFFKENIASKKVMEKCGMTLTEEVEYIEYKGMTHECHTCEIINTNG